MHGCDGKVQLKVDGAPVSRFDLATGLNRHAFNLGVGDFALVQQAPVGIGIRRCLARRCGCRLGWFGFRRLRIGAGCRALQVFHLNHTDAHASDGLDHAGQRQHARVGFHVGVRSGGFGGCRAEIAGARLGWGAFWLWTRCGLALRSGLGGHGACNLAAGGCAIDFQPFL